MSTIKVDKIVPFQSSSVEIEGAIAVGGATTGSNDFVGNQTISGSLLLDGSEVNMTASLMRFTTTGTGSITFVPGGSIRFQGNTDFTNPVRVPIINVDNLAGGGFYGFNDEVDGRIYQDFSGSVDSRINAIVAGTGFATTGSNTFTGNQTITGSVNISGSAEFDLTIEGRQLITGPTTGQTPQLLISGSDFNNRIGRVTAYVNKGNRTFGSGYSHGRLDSAADISETAILNVGVFDEPNFVTDIELLVQVNTGSGIQFQDIRNDTYAYETWLKIAPNTGNTPPLEFKRNVEVTGSLHTSGSSTVTGNFVVNTVDTLPEGIPGQIAFESGKMWVYLNGQWNEVQFVAPPEPSFIQFNVVGPETSSNDACDNSDEPITYYSDSDLGSFGVGSTVYTDDELTVTADDGFYKLTNNGTWFEVSGSAGEIVDEASCE
jgi:hypothetical protein